MAALPSIATLNLLADARLRWTRIKLNWTHAVLSKAQLDALPCLYAQDSKGMDAIAQVHFFGGPFDFWATEFDPAEGRFFGLVGIHGNEPELGYLTARELCTTFYPARMIDAATGQSARFKMPFERDLYFTPCPLSQVGAR